MKTWGLGLLLISWSLGCYQDKAVPAEPDLLYQRWRLTQTFYAANNQQVNVSDQDWAITEFRRNGMILYGATGRYTACCSPNRFKRDGNKLDFTNVSSIPVPETDNLNSCASVYCVALGDSWQILTLTTKQLVLKTDYGTNTYQPYP